MRNLVNLFCHVDDFCKLFMPQWQKYLIESGECQRLRQTRMTSSEIMTIIIAFHMSHQRDFKHFYIGFIAIYHKKDFPTLSPRKDSDGAAFRGPDSIKSSSRAQAI